MGEMQIEESQFALLERRDLETQQGKSYKDLLTDKL